MWIKDENTREYAEWFYFCKDNGERYKNHWPIYNVWHDDGETRVQVLVATDDDGEEHEIELRKLN